MALVTIIISTSRYPIGISTEFCFKWQKNLQGGKGKGIRGGKGEKTEGEKIRKKTMERGRIEPPLRIDLAQELPVTYCDSQASL